MTGIMDTKDLKEIAANLKENGLFELLTMILDLMRFEQNYTATKKLCNLSN